MNDRQQCKCSLPKDGSEPAQSRLMGVYPQRQEGLFMQRVRILGGRISWLQWRKLADLAVSYTPDTPLHITTRQDLEMHNVKPPFLPIIQNLLGEIGLSTYGACGDSVRNITACTGCSYSVQAGGVYPVALAVERHLKSNSNFVGLPRKLKISFSGCLMACARPWLSDIGFVRQSDGRFTAIGAGSLGPRPALGIELYKDLAIQDILSLCVAAMELFEREGDRQNRSRARLRHVRERLGDATFQADLDRRFKELRARNDWPRVESEHKDRNLRLLWRLQLPNGNISSADAIELANAAEPAGAEIRINLDHGLELYGKRMFRLPPGLAYLTDKPVTIACPGASTCSRGITDTWAAAEQIRQALSGQGYGGVRVCISGCPNSCACSTVAEIGLVGMLKKENGGHVQYYRLFVDGGEGNNNRLAKELAAIKADDVGRTIRDLLDGKRATRV